MTLTLLAIVGMAAIGGACDGLPTLRQAHRSEAVADKGIPNDDLLVPDLQTSVTEGDVGLGGVAGHGQRCGRRAGVTRWSRPPTTSPRR